MIRKIITIDEAKCNGCGLCAKACHEGAIGMKNGKAVLLREDYCDGLGDCLPACPTGAISFEMREAKAYDEAAVKAAQKAQQPCACQAEMDAGPSQLRNFPIQLKLAAPNAPWLQDADLLIAADCTAYACPDFHRTYMKDRVTLVGCPKLDGSYADKLAEIFRCNRIRSITVVRMQVPCCGGLPFAVKTALEDCGKNIPCRVVILGTDGRVIAEQ